MRGDYVHELFFLLKCLVPTLTEEVTGDMRILPLLAAQDAALGDYEDTDKSDDITLELILAVHMKEVSSQLATKADKVREILRDKLQLKTERAVSDLLKTKGILKSKACLQSEGNVWTYAYHFERNGISVWLALRD